MKTNEKIDTMREGWEVAIRALEKNRSFLHGLSEHVVYKLLFKDKIQKLLEETEIAAAYAEMYFTPEVINGTNHQPDPESLA